MTQQDSSGADRVDWVDYAKGWCIVLVVTMHSTLGVGEAFGRESWLHDFVAWARPFRMPDFFLVAGLFLDKTIDKGWRVYLDRKAVHFLYFYLLWTFIQGVPKLLISESLDPAGVARGLAFALVEPFGTLWFIYLLPVFFIVTKLLRGAPVLVVLFAAALLQTSAIHTGWIMIDEFTARYVYFFAGYAFAPRFFALASRARAHAAAALAALAVWGMANAFAVNHGVAAMPVVSLALGFAGAAAVVAFSALLARARMLAFLRDLGSRSLVIYLAFFLPMAATRIFLVKTQLIGDAGAASLIVTAAAIALPLALHRVTKGGKWRFLFERPQAFRLRGRETRERMGVTLRPNVSST
jgi:uncharacterized membrane protein YcfT